MDENEAHELSCQIEPTHPSSNVSKESRFKRRITPIINHRKNDSIASTVSGSSSSSTPMLCETDGSVKEEDVPDGALSSSGLNDSMGSRVSSASSLSTPSLDTSLVNLTPTKCDKADTPKSDPYKTPDFYIIRVSWETSSAATEGVIMYKSIMLSNREHTREVICSAMLKHGIEGSPEDFTLSQVLPDKGNINQSECEESMLSIIISRVTNPAKCQRLLRHQHPARPQLRAEAPRGHHQGQGEGGGAVQRLQLHPGQEERHQQGKEKAAWSRLVITTSSPTC